MNPNRLDELLTRSAPSTYTTMAADDVRAAVQEARAEGLPRSPRRRRFGLAAAAASVAGLTAIGGVAWAASTMPQGFDDPWAAADYRHSFELPSGRGCELRVMVVDDQGGRKLDVQSEAVSRWIAAADFWGALDFDAARAKDAEDAATNPAQTLVLDANGRLGDSQTAPADRTADDIFASVVSLASDAALNAGLAEQGARRGEVMVWDSVRCDAVTE
ncbi:hypothetical protein [Microbacterium sp. NPDC079995]|uniref:hypothetical protein n=1 Tax=unclassified Microbacterium TaxID=2609290 RepID=UPI00344DDDE2